MPSLYAPAPTEFDSSAASCDCLAHPYGNAADQLDRERRHPSDMTDAEWAAIRPLFPVPAWLQGRGGQPEGHCHRQMLDAIRYLVAGGISWRAMPADFPTWARVYAFFRRRREHGLIAEFHDRLRGKVREREGREAEPSAGIIDAQSVRAAATVPAASRGYDGGKKVPGRKRHIVTDTLACSWPSPSPPRTSATGTPRRACFRGCVACTATSPSYGPTAATPAPSSTGATTNSPSPWRSSNVPTPWRDSWCFRDAGWWSARSRG